MSVTNNLPFQPRNIADVARFDFELHAALEAADTNHSGKVESTELDSLEPAMKARYETAVEWLDHAKSIDRAFRVLLGGVVMVGGTAFSVASGLPGASSLFVALGSMIAAYES